MHCNNENPDRIEYLSQGRSHDVTFIRNAHKSISVLRHQVLRVRGAIVIAESLHHDVCPRMIHSMRATEGGQAAFLVSPLNESSIYEILSPSDRRASPPAIGGFGVGT